jgi:predicted nuclease with RNAse H fold
VRSLGIDVGVAKGLDLVLMDERRVPLAVRSHSPPGEVGALIEEFHPDVIAIDSPPRWAASGRSRRTERELAACNIQSFNTPSEIHGRGNAFFAWMEVGFEVFRAANDRGFPTYGGGSPRRRAMEVFPHATPWYSAGSLPPKGVSKRVWRERVLHAQGVRTDELTSIDRIDAALAALTGLMALQGKRFAPGRPAGGGHHAAGEHATGHAVPSRGERPERRGPLVQLLCVRRPGVPDIGAWRVRAGSRRETQGDALAAGTRRPGIDRRARGARMEATPGDALSEAWDAMRFETRAIHAGQEPEALYGSVNVPIYQTATYAQDEVGRPKRWDYGRGGNPTREAFQVALAALEGGTHAFAFASGMAAETTLLLTLRPGDHVILANDVYGGTYRLLANVLSDWGLASSTVDLADEPALREAILPTTKLVWAETPSNPMLKIVDLAAVRGDRARGRRARGGRQHVRDARRSSVRSNTARTPWSTA